MGANEEVVMSPLPFPAPEIGESTKTAISEERREEILNKGNLVDAAAH